MQIKSRTVLLMLAVTLLVAAAGCGSKPFLEAGQTTIVPFTDEEIVLRNDAKAAVYKLRPGDQFGVIFQYEPDLNQRGIIVMPDGHISIVGAEGIQAAGLGIDELDTILTDRLAREYEHPDLTIIIEDFGSSQVYVLGEVARPGIVDLTPNGMGVLQAISIGGGFLEDAAQSETVVIRLTEQGYQYRRVNLDHLEKGGLAASVMMDLQPNDIVYVPRSAIGDLAYFNKTVLTGLLSISRLYWDFYALTNIDKVDRLLR